MRAWSIGLVLVLVVTALAGTTDVGAVLRRYEQARDAAGRRAAAAELAGCEGPRALLAIDRIARHDDDVDVRVAAVGALANRPDGDALTCLLELAADGGPRAVRVAFAEALATYVDAVARVHDALASRRVDALDRMRLIETLGGVPTLDAYGELLAAARGDDAFARTAALRAIAVHEIGRTEIADTLLDALRSFRDVDTVATVLDLVEDHAIDRWEEFAPLVADRTEPAIQEAALTLAERFAFIDAVRLAAKKDADGYGIARDEIPREPTPRSRLDMVYAFDATGSAVGQIRQVKKFIAEHAAPLLMVRHDARIGIVAYRVGEKATPRTRTEVLPLTHDVRAALRFVDEIDQRGADSQGAAVAGAVATALDRMPWRPNARRQVYLLADSRIDDRPRAWRIARQHHEADGTQLSVWYWSNTRQREPEDLKRLADDGGGTFTIADPAPPQPPFFPGTPPPGSGSTGTGR